MAEVLLLAILPTVPVLLLVVLLHLLLECNITGIALVSPGMNSGSPRPSLHISTAFGLEIDMYHVLWIAYLHSG